MIKSRNSLILILAVILMMTCIPVTAIAETENIYEIDLFERGYTIIDAEGNVVPQSRENIGGGVTLKPGEGIFFNTQFSYSGNFLTLSVSTTGGHVYDLEATAHRISTSEFRNLGYFSAISGDWYGQINTQLFGGAVGKYLFGIGNDSNVVVVIDSCTALNR